MKGGREHLLTLHTALLQRWPWTPPLLRVLLLRGLGRPVGSSVTPLLMQKAGTESGAWGLLASALGHGQNLDRFPHPIL